MLEDMKSSDVTDVCVWPESKRYPAQETDNLYSVFFEKDQVSLS